MPATATRPRADDDTKKDAAPAAKKSKKKLIIAGVAVLAIGGGGAYKFLAPTPPPAPPSGGEIVSMDPTTLNLTDGHYLKVAVAIQLLKGKATAADFQSSEAAELVIDEFSNRSVANLSSNANRKQLTDDLAAKIKTAYKDEVYTIYITQFVTQ